jgi:hypothetical protein
MPASPAWRTFGSEVLSNYAALVVTFALLKTSAPLWGGAHGFLGSLSWPQIAVGTAIAAACACGSQHLAAYFVARQQSRVAGD